MHSSVKWLFSTILALAWAMSAYAQTAQLKPGVKIPQDIQYPQNPQIKDYLKKHKLMLPPVARARSASLSVYAIPWENFCRDNPDDATQGRVTVQMKFPRRADGSSVPAVLVVHVGSREYRTNVSLGAGEFAVTSSVFPLPATEFCSDRCVDYHLEARNSADASKVDSRRRSACL